MSPATLRVKRGDTLSRVFAWQELMPPACWRCSRR